MKHSGGGLFAVLCAAVDAILPACRVILCIQYSDYTREGKEGEEGCGRWKGQEKEEDEFKLCTKWNC